eukprot:3637593-Rhodomonas_salina.1
MRSDIARHLVGEYRTSRSRDSVSVPAKASAGHRVARRGVQTRRKIAPYDRPVPDAEHSTRTAVQISTTNVSIAHHLGPNAVPEPDIAQGE